MRIAKNNVDKYKPDPEGLYLILNKLRLSQNSKLEFKSELHHLEKTTNVA